MYLTADSEIHVCTREICDALGSPYTPENAAIAERAALAAIREIWPAAGGVMVQHVD